MSRRHSLIWSAVALAAGGVFIELAREVLTRSGLTGLDLPIATFVAGHRLAWLAAIFDVLTWAGSAFTLVPLTLTIGLLFWVRQGTIRPLVLLGAALGGAAVLYGILKPTVGRLRPPAALQYGPPDSGWAFPSGHTTQAAAFYGMLAVLLLATPRSNRRLFASGAGLVAVLVGFTRLYLGVHWLTDVLGALALGILWVAIIELAASFLDWTAVESATRRFIPSS